VRQLVGLTLAWTAILCLPVAALADDDDDGAKRTKPNKRAARRAQVAADLPPGLQRAPYVQAIGGDSALVAWIADAPEPPVVDYGPTLAYGMSVAAESDGTRRVATLRGLSPERLYFYRVRAGERVLREGEELRFRSDGGRGDERFAFFVTGDIGDARGRQALTAQSILRSEPRPELGLICGDVVYPDGHSDDYDFNLMLPWRALMQQVPVWPALGNHDWHVDPQDHYRREWYLPNNEHYYSFDWGTAHFIALDTRDDRIYDLDNQVRWLEADLAAHRDALWTFVYFHHPALTCTYKGDTRAVVQYLMPVFDRFAVDVVFTGHAHTYERLYPIRDRKPVGVEQDPDYVDPAGTIYIVSGAGAKVKKRRPTSYCGPTAFFRDETILWTHVEIDGRRCTIRTQTSADDAVVDRITITKSHGPASD
jgi:hypothetical protein